MKRLLFVALAGAALFACHTTETITVPNDAQATPSGDAAADAPADATHDAGIVADAAPDAGGPCDGLKNDAPNVDFEMLAADPPTMTGGEFADGKYFLTSFRVYGGATAMAGPLLASNHVVLVVAGATMKFVDDSGPFAWTSSTKGPVLVASHLCPKKYTSTLTYTATPTTLGIAFEQNGLPLVETFTKQ